MAFEIELKAWVDEREAVERRIGEIARFTADFEKQDVYWFQVSQQASGDGVPLSGVRIRRETARGREQAPKSLTLVTYKTKELRGGIEVNDEKEFSVSHADAFEELLRRLGFKPGIAKNKRGRSWKYGGLTVELSDVERLGCFIELEIMAGDDRPETIEAAKNSLYDFLTRAGVSKERIEPRYYNEMLARQ